jgi:DNA-directed RNA polymerase specialized sigma24 family protein
MMAGCVCDCLICRLEASLAQELSREKGLKEFRRWAGPNEILARFQTASELIGHLHRQGEDRNATVDQLIVELVRVRAQEPFEPIAQSLLLLVFVPTLHRTASQISVTFPSLSRDDTAQHLFAALIEFLDSQELRAHRSHLAFVVARKMRRSAFRWAIRESRRNAPAEPGRAADPSPEADEVRDETHAAILLAKYLDDCQNRGWLSQEERELLTRFKLEGVTGAEIGGRSGHSAVAIRHRVQRLLERLRRVAQKSGAGAARQLDLFRP